MRRHLILATVLVAQGAILVGSTPILAEFESTGGSTGGGNVNVSASTTAVLNGGGSSGGPVCVWTRLTRGDLSNIGGSGGADGETLAPEESAEVATNEVGGELFEVYSVNCPGQATQLRLVDPSTTAADLFDTITDAVTRAIPEPEHDINPSPAVGSFVNLGLWLSAVEQNIAPITAEAGPAWITASPALVNVTFDMGNGDVIDCNGLGVAYPDGANDPNEGPCGYTYLTKLADDAEYTITVTTEWTIPYTSSSGPGTLTPIASTTSFTYDIDEVQTVGTG